MFSNLETLITEVNFYKVAESTPYEYYRCVWNQILPYSSLYENSMAKEKYVWILIIRKTVGEKYPDNLLLLVKFWSARSMDTLQSHEAAGEDLITDAGRSRDSNNMAGFIHTTIFI